MISMPHVADKRKTECLHSVFLLLPAVAAEVYQNVVEQRRQ